MTTVKQRGRPIDPLKQQLQRNKLLKAAQQLLDGKAYSQITIRDIASVSGINSAMIKYYFGNKDGLFIALLNQIADEHFLSFEELNDTAQPVLKFIEAFGQLLRARPGFVHLLGQEVLGKTTPLAEAFMQAFPMRVSKFLPRLVAMETGIADPVRAKVAAFHLVTSLVSPFLFRAVRQYAWQIDDELLFGSHWCKDSYQHFLEGFKESKDHELELST
ncbi:TetR/AcrR family transcriptional regulator [Pseudoalteromonas fenneropenaei]|uniref:TetR/AcrR family transcriptional regulator n=1 Tax=Pseudoalteromonas fenneropenaei TaxID=1737459 RepID=A0ABV7CJL7_9GAMM